MRLSRLLSLCVSLAAVSSHLAPPSRAATASWLSPTSGSWTDGARWSTSPNYPSDNTFDASIAAAGTAYTVTLASNISVNNISLNSPDATLVQTSASTLTLAGIFDVHAGAFSLSSGILSGTLQTSGGTAVLGAQFAVGPKLNAATLAGPITTYGTLGITNGLTLNTATLNLAGTVNQVLFAGSQAITGTGQIVFADSDSGSLIAPADDASTLTIGSGITITSNPPSFANVTIGRVTAPLINNGTITCNTANLNINLTGANWVNNGTINLSAGAILLAGSTTTANLGTIHNTGGALILVGTIDNTAATLDLANIGSLQVNQGTIRGGAIVDTSSLARLYTNGSSLTLDAVTLGVDLDHTAHNGNTSSVLVKNGITFNNHNIILSPGVGIVAQDASTFGGTGQIILNSSDSGTSTVGGTNVTIGPNVTIRTGSGSQTGRSTVTALLNQGTISLQALGTPIIVTDTVPWTNAGFLKVATSTLTVSGNWTNTGSMIATGGTLILNGTWSNPGSITATNAVVNVGGTGSGLNNISVTTGGAVITGSYTTAQALTINRTQSYLGVGTGGVLDNTGNIFTVNDPAAPLKLLGGTFREGSIVASNGGQVTASTSLSVLDTVVLNAPISGSGGHLNTTNLTNNSSISLPNAGSLQLAGAWTNNGSISAAGTSVVFMGTPGSFGTITLSNAFDYLYCAATTAQLKQINCTKVSWSLNDGASIDNTGNNLVLSQAVANWAFYGGQILGGTISSTDGTQLTITRSSSYLFTSLIMDGITLATGAQLSGSAIPTIKDGLTLANNAIIQCGVSSFGPGSLSFSGTQTLTGSGTIFLQGDGTAMPKCYSTAGTLTIDTNITVRSGANAGALGDPTLGSIINKGLVSAQNNAVKLTINGNFTNQGTVEARNGGIISIASPSLLTNLQSGNLVGGTWNVFAASTLTLPAVSITTNTASITLNGSTSSFPALNTLANNFGAFNLSGGRVFTTSAAFNNHGLIDLFAASELDLGSLLEQSDGTLAFELAKGSAVNGRLVINGAATLDGALSWSLASGYTPIAGDSFTLINALSLSGGFANVSPPPLPPGLAYSLQLSANSLQISFSSVPEPSSLCALLSAVFLLWSRPKRHPSNMPSNTTQKWHSP